MVGPIVDAITDWDNSDSNASGKNGSLVWFNLADQYTHQFTYLFLANSGQFRTTDGKVNPNVYAYTNFSNGNATTTFYLGSAVLNSSLSTFAAMIRKGAKHEIGHTMGLSDQPASPAQTQGQSVMNLAMGVNDSEGNMAANITSCDNQGVKNSYASDPGSGSGTNQGNGYSIVYSEYTVEDDSEAGCACYTTYQEADYYYNGIFQYSTSTEISYWCTC